jgi:hypothetical protein
MTRLELWMESMEAYRKACLNQQTELRRLLTGRSSQHERAIQLLLSQHAMLHSAKMARTGPWSFEDEVLDDMSAGEMRRIPQGCEHSVAWLIWHMARCEDITMNLLVAGSPQVLHEHWLEQMKIAVRDTGNAMDEKALVDFSNMVDLEALRAYRVAVGRRTREIAGQLQPEDLKRKVQASRLQQIREEGAVVEAAGGLLDYWGKRDVAGLLLMPATRHNIVHLNEALEVKRKRP